MTQKHTVTFIAGDGIGPEVTTATRQIIDATGAGITWEDCDAGAGVFKKGLKTGVPQETIDSITRNGVALKGPLETPVGYGEKSANVTLRKMFETFANIRPIREFPMVPSPYQGRKIDLVIVRENVEDLYAGIEYMQTPAAAQTLKLMTRKGCEKIVRTAFEFARADGRKRVQCATKANIMKFSEGLLKRTFEDIAPEYPDITASHIIVDNCAHQLVRFPEKFDVIVTSNMNGDILSDLGSGLIGGLGFAPGANLGNTVAIFEAVHGSAPKYAGQNTINPTAVLLSGVMMLRHLNEFKAADLIENALLVTLQNKIFTRDVCGDHGSVSTTAFTGALIDNLGKTSDFWPSRPRKPLIMPTLTRDKAMAPMSRQVIGFDVFIESTDTAQNLGQGLERLLNGSGARLKTISNRGVQVYPHDTPGTDAVDLWICRIVAREDGAAMDDDGILSLLGKIGSQYKWMHMEKLSVFGGQDGFSKTHGED